MALGSLDCLTRAIDRCHLRSRYTAEPNRRSWLRQARDLKFRLRLDQTGDHLANPVAADERFTGGCDIGASGSYSDMTLSRSPVFKCSANTLANLRDRVATWWHYKLTVNFEG